jgi:hypothetical protein
MPANTLFTEGFRYPYFEPNQVLKHSDLNQITAYLSQQQRSSRTHLIGMGIVGGLELTYQATTHAIHLSDGVGLSSEGYLFAWEGQTFTHYRSVEIDRFRFQAGEWMEASPQLSPSNLKVPLFELGTADETSATDQGWLPLSEGDSAGGLSPADFLADKIGLLLIEPLSERRDSCLVDCDDKGRDISYRLRVLMLPRTGEEGLSAQELLEEAYPTGDLPTVWGSDTALQEAFHGWYHTSRVAMQRFGPTTFVEGSHQLQRVDHVDLTQIKQLGDYLRGYYAVCRQAIGDLSEALNQLHRLFSPFFTPMQVENDYFDGLSADLQAMLDQIVPAAYRNPDGESEMVVSHPEDQLALQYFYDYLLDLIAAYDELREVAFDLMADCPPDLNRFPKYLMLGPVIDAGEVCAPPSIYRSHFIQPPIYNDNRRRLAEVKHLHERLRRMAQRGAEAAFTLLPYPQTPVKLTPSQGRMAPLSERAIPFYHRYPQLYRHWSYDHGRKGRAATIPSYFKPEGAEPSDREWRHNIDQYPFFRVEGHIGRDMGEAIEAIVRYQQTYNLPFDVIALQLAAKGSREQVRLNGQFDDLEIEYGKLVTEFGTRFRWYTKWFYAATSSNPLVVEIYNLLFQNGEPVKLRDLAFPSEAQDPDELTGGSRSFFSYILWLAQSPDNYHWVRNDQEYGLFLFDADVTGPLILTDLENIERPIARVALKAAITLDAPPTEEEEQALEADLRAIIERLASSFSGVRAPRFRSMDIVNDAGNVSGKRLAIGFWNTAGEGEPAEYLSETINDLAVQIPLVLHSSEVYANDLELRNDYPEFETLYRLLQEEDSSVASQINYYGFMTLARAYRDRLDQLLTLNTFHGFAAEHPGMEHLAGVPAGGTLILVYAEEEELLTHSNQNAFGIRANEALVTRELVGSLLNQLVLPAGLSASSSNSHSRVVADFALPYRCSSDGLNVAYVITPQKPIILLDRMVFCKGAAPSTFILDPPGGNVSGVGVVSDANGQPAFAPSLDEVEPGLITFTYVVNNTYDTLTVRVYPAPNLDVSLAQTAFCVEDEPITLSLAPSPEAENLELERVLIDGAAINQFNPKNYAVQDLPTDVIVQLVLRDRRSGCQGTTERTLTVYPMPDAGFGFSQAPQNGGFCIDAKVVNLIPNRLNESVSFTVIYPDGQVRNQPFIDMSLIGEITSSTTVTIDHLARYSNGATCAASTRQTVTIFPLPDAGFTLASGQNENGVYEFCANDEPVAIQGANSGDSFELYGPTGDLLSSGVLSNPWHFSPADAFTGGAEAQNFTLIQRVTGSGGCEAQSQVNIAVYPEIEPGTFEWEVRFPSEGANSFQLRIFNVVSTGNNRLMLTPPPPDGQTVPPAGGIVTYQYQTSDTPDGVPIGTEINVTLTVESESGICASASTMESVRVPFGIEATFLRWENDGAVEINLNNEPEINIQDLNASSPYSIGVLPFPREVGSMIIHHTDPNSAKISSGPLNSPSGYTLQLPGRPSPGEHTVRVEIFSEPDGNGVPGEEYATSFTIIEPVVFRGIEEDNAEEQGNNPAPLLNQRAAARRQQLDDLSQDNSSLANSKSYKQAQLFLMLPIDAAEGDLLRQAQEAAEKLINSYQRANEANQPAYASALTLVLQATMDRLLMQGEVSEAAQETFAQLNERLAKAELDPKPIQRGWARKALEAAFDSKQIKAVEKLL